MKRVCVRRLRRTPTSSSRGPGRAVADVVGDGRGEHGDVLRHERDAAAKGIEIGTT